VVEVRRRTVCAGGASNVALNIASLGGMPLLCGSVGTDAAAEQLTEILAERIPIADSLLAPLTDRPTTLKSRVIAHSQQMLRLDTEETRPIPGEVEDGIIAWVEGQMASARACVLSDYAKGVLTDRICREIIALGAARRVPVIIDPKGTRYERYAGCALITPNRQEAGLAVNRKFKTGDGEQKEEVLFVDCTAFGKPAEILAKYCQKGKPLFVEGRLKLDTWEDKQGGGKRSKISVVVENFQFLGGPEGGAGGGDSDQRAKPKAKGEDDIPF
jgi:rfaE bifunctional protein kinase chain/domain